LSPCGQGIFPILWALQQRLWMVGGIVQQMTSSLFNDDLVVVNIGVCGCSAILDLASGQVVIVILSLVR
jgi:hypothetical protein